MSAFARWEDPRHVGRLDVAPVIPRKATREGQLLDALGAVGDLIVTLDFETFWEQGYTLRGNKTTTESYVRDSRFEVIGVGVKVGDRPTVWLEEWEFRLRAKRVDWNRVVLVAHHAQFDAFILAHHYGIVPRFIVCTMSMARALHGVYGAGLNTLGPKYGLGTKGEELKNTKGKRRVDFTPAEWLAFGAYCKNDVDLTFGLFREMRKTFPPLEFWLVDTTIRMFTEPRFRADRAVLERARDAERERKGKLLLGIAESEGLTGTDDARVEAARAMLASNDKFAALLRANGVEPPTKAGKKGEIFAFAKDDPGFQSLLEHEDDAIRALAETRLAVKSTITETRAERIMQVAERGAVPFYLKYAGAHTHRWSGGDKMNPQNFNRGGELRAAILAPEAEILAVSDSAQIEARVLPWFAGETRLLETFRRNDKTDGDFYSDEGSRFFLKPISKKDTPLERQVSKNMILGLGFSMGWTKFSGELLKGMLGSPPVQFGMNEAQTFRVDVVAFEQRRSRIGTCGQVVEKMRRGGIRLSYRDLLVHCAVADHFVRLYRGTNTKIAAVWKHCEDLLRAMEPDGDPDEIRMTFGPIKVVRHGLVKPNGLVLQYPGLRRTGDGFVYLGGKSGHERTKIYGGLVTENIVQSLARDIVAEQVLWVRAKYATAGRRSVIGTTTHDEIVAIVPREKGAECLEYMKRVMRSPPSWCRDLPLNATGEIARRYGDCK